MQLDQLDHSIPSSGQASSLYALVGLTHPDSDAHTGAITIMGTPRESIEQVVPRGYLWLQIVEFSAKEPG